jgi:GNAT superfamily N-acetyltransferase
MLSALTLTPSNRDSKRKQLPISLIVIDCDTDAVIGHVSVISIATSEANVVINLPFIQSVIVDKKLRGVGLGRALMIAAEVYFIGYAKQPILVASSNDELAVSRFDHLYLNTKDKQGFYESLGYVEIEPILFFANKSNSKCNEIIKSLFKSMTVSSGGGQHSQVSEIRQEKREIIASSVSQGPTPPPPPPPMPKIEDSLLSNKLSWYKKRVNLNG